MPNWCMGDLTITGPKEKIVKFLTECVEPPYEVEGNLCRAPKKTNWAPRILGTHRTFLGGDSCVYEITGNEITIDAMAAWSFNPEEFSNLSDIYKLRVYCRAEEPGMVFTQEFEVEDGEVKMNETYDYVSESEEEDDEYWKNWIEKKEEERKKFEQQYGVYGQ